MSAEIHPGIPPASSVVLSQTLTDTDCKPTLKAMLGTGEGTEDTKQGLGQGTGKEVQSFHPAFQGLLLWSLSTLPAPLPLSHPPPGLKPY